jgi:hypothetical protein
MALDARRDYQRTNLQRESASASDRYERAGTVAIGLAVTAAITTALGLVLWARER